MERLSYHYVPSSAAGGPETVKCLCVCFTSVSARLLLSVAHLGLCRFAVVISAFLPPTFTLPTTPFVCYYPTPLYMFPVFTHQFFPLTLMCVHDSTTSDIDVNPCIYSSLSRRLHFYPPRIQSHTEDSSRPVEVPGRLVRFGQPSFNFLSLDEWGPILASPRTRVMAPQLGEPPDMSLRAQTNIIFPLRWQT